MSDNKPLPLLIVKTGTVSKEDIKRAEDAAFILIIESDDPDSARFMEPPIMADIDAQSRAALELMRIFSQQRSDTSYSVGNLSRIFVDALLKGIKPEPLKKVKP